MLISCWTKNKCTRAIHDKNKNLVSKAQCVHRIIQPQKIKTHAQTQKLIALMDFCSHHFFMKISFYFWFIMCHLKNIVFLEKKNKKTTEESYEIHYMLHFFHLLVSLCPFPRVRRADAAVLASWLVKLTFFKSQFQAIPGHFNTNVKIEAWRQSWTITDLPRPPHFGLQQPHLY